MMDDVTPRLAPPPKPTTLELSTPKPVVPEVSLMFDSDDSLIWQGSRHSLPNERATAFGNQLSQDKDQICTQIVGNSKSSSIQDVGKVLGKNTYSNSSPRISQVRNVHFESSPRYISSQVKDSVAGGILPRRLNDSQENLSKYVGTSPLISPSINTATNERPYNPQVYSPAHKIAARNDLYDFGTDGLKKHVSPMTKNKMPVVQNYATCTEKILTHPHSSQNDVNPYIFKNGSALKPLINQVLPAIKNTTHPIETETNISIKNSDFSNNSPLLQNKENVSSQVNEERMNSVHRNYFSPLSTSLPLQALQTNQNFQGQRSLPINQECVHPEPPSYYPLAGGRLYSPTDPMVYHLIEDQNLQILKLTKTLDYIMRKQQEIESPKDVATGEVVKDKIIYAKRSSLNRECLQREISTQTSDSTIPETKSVGVNTDLTWMDFVDSDRQCDTVANHLGSSYGRRPRCDQEKEESLTERNDLRTEQATPVNMTNNCGDIVSESNNGCPRNDRSVEWVDSLALGESAKAYENNLQAQNQSSSSVSGPPGVTFYNNVMTNIKQILQNSKTAEEEKGQTQHNEDIIQSRRPVEAEVVETVEPPPDPQIEAVRKQLVQFGISFIDPVTLTSNHKTIMDTMYLPGIQNIMYQSTISTHYQTPCHETDATAAKYLTDSQLAAIAAMSPAMKKRNGSESAVTDDTSVPQFSSSQEKKQSQFYKFNNNDFSIATKKFLDRYGLQDN
ncbi:hypothetical protein OTU49_015245 [Cherax quadricarinatus]|uniref:Uncharacterized protein n=1 Tax=Cherax quadricarinatus TaxID=27406 RepID=A0AAW0YIR6_CHEQU